MKKILIFSLLPILSYAEDVCVIDFSFLNNTATWNVQTICTDASDNKKFGSTNRTVKTAQLKVEAAKYLLEKGYKIENLYFTK